MSSNPTLKRLGLAPDDRVVILHADDIGMCHATVQAYADLLEFGLLSSAAVMMPCPWALSAAEVCRANPQADMGVHLTLTCEWPVYRWGPLSTRNQTSGMIDSDGYFYRTSAEVQQNSAAEAVSVELEMQIQSALKAGIDVTHVDTHMGSVVSAEYLPIFIANALKYDLIPAYFRWDADRLRGMGYSDETIAAALEAIRLLVEHEVPLLDHMQSMPLDDAWGDDDRVALFKDKLRALEPGITHFIIHPAADTPELRAIAGDWRGRVGDYQLLLREDVRDFIHAEGIHIIGYKTLREL